MRRLPARIFVIGLLVSLGAGVQAEPWRDRIEAAYLYRISSYVTWPEQAFPKVDSPIVIAVYANQALTQELTRMVRGREVNGRALFVKDLDTLSNLDGIHLLYVNPDNARKLPALQERLNSGFAVTASREAGDAFQPMINFVQVSNKIRFDIANKLAGQKGLSFSADLLSVARNVN